MMSIEKTGAPIPLLVADVYELAGLFRREGERIARTVGRTQGQWQVLSAASAGSKTVAQIARRLGYARQSVQRTADQLVRDRLALYAQNPDHKRSPYLELTNSGREVLERLTRAAQSSHTSLSRKIDPKDAQAALRVMRSLCAVLNKSRDD